MTEAEIIADVKIKMDESTPSGVSHSFDDYINQMLDEATKDILDQVPVHLLDATEIPVTATELYYDDNLAYIIIPSDFIRLYELKFQNWKKVVREVIGENDKRYRYQDDEFLKSGYGKPTVMVKYADPDADSTLEKCLVCGKVSENEPVVVARYVKSPTAGTLHQAALLPVILHESASWLAASKVLSIAGEYDASKYALEQYSTLINEKV